MTQPVRFRGNIRNKRTLIGKNVHPVFTAALLPTATIGKRPKCPSADRWMKKPGSIHTAEHHSALEKSQTLPLAAPGKDQGGYLSEMSQSKKCKHREISLVPGICRKHRQARFKQTHRHREQADGCQRGGVKSSRCVCEASPRSSRPRGLIGRPAQWGLERSRTF